MDMKESLRHNLSTGSAEAISVEQVAEEANDGQKNGSEESKRWIENEWLMVGISLVLLVAGLVLDFFFKPAWFSDAIRLIWYVVAYVPVGLPVVTKGIRLAFRGELFTEFFLMSVATIGAFYIGEYPEGVAVMLFYAVGELFQDAAVSRAKRSIKALLDVRPDTILNAVRIQRMRFS